MVEEEVLCVAMRRLPEKGSETTPITVLSVAVVVAAVAASNIDNKGAAVATAGTEAEPEAEAGTEATEAGGIFETIDDVSIGGETLPEPDGPGLDKALCVFAPVLLTLARRGGNGGGVRVRSFCSSVLALLPLPEASTAAAAADTETDAGALTVLVALSPLVLRDAMPEPSDAAGVSDIGETDEIGEAAGPLCLSLGVSAFALSIDALLEPASALSLSFASFSPLLSVFLSLSSGLGTATLILGTGDCCSNSISRALSLSLSLSPSATDGLGLLVVKMGSRRSWMVFFSE